MPEQIGELTVKQFRMYIDQLNKHPQSCPLFGGGGKGKKPQSKGGIQEGHTNVDSVDELVALGLGSYEEVKVSEGQS